jgi:hypothetical protein
MASNNEVFAEETEGVPMMLIQSRWSAKGFLDSTRTNSIRIASAVIESKLFRTMVSLIRLRNRKRKP